MSITEYLAELPVHEYAVIDTSRVPFSDEVEKMCKANRCGRYGTCWTCPPGVGTLDMWREKLNKYPKTLVYTCKYDLEDSFDFETMAEGAKATQKVLRTLTAKLREDGVKFTALGCEGCGLCEKCTYPDAPCRHPELAIPSVEACGISVVQLAADTGLRYNNGKDTVTYFNLIAFEENV